MAQAFPKTYRLSDFEESSNMDVDNSEWSIVYELEVEKGTAEHLGRGTVATQENAEGRIYAQLQNSTPSALDGKIRFTKRTKQGRLRQVYTELDLDEIAAGAAASDRGKRYPFPNAMNGYLGYPYKLCVEVKLHSGSDTVDTSQSELKADGRRAEA